jgi:2-hydroxycyclohexanecarboxyl-CoA dehydrogenase
MRGLREKHVLITGAAGGIGQALCQRFAEEGAVVLATDLDESRLATLRASLLAAGHACEVSALDITDYAAVAALVATLIANHGRIDVLVNNAGWDLPSLFLDTTPDFWQKVIAVNLNGPLNLQHCVVSTW